jgi:hypothetical protein
MSPEESYERVFLFVLQIPRDAGSLGGLHPDLDGLERYKSGCDLSFATVVWTATSGNPFQGERKITAGLARTFF